VSVIRPVNFLEPSVVSDPVEFVASDQSIPPSGRHVEPSSHNVNAAGAVYADVVRGANPDPVAYVPDEQNELPSRPLTVFFNPRSRVPAHEVFTALQAANIDNGSVSCIQRQSSGEIVLTFRNAHAKEQFLTHNVINIRDQPFALQDIDRPLTYMQIFDAPHEMPDATIVQRLAKYCDVIHQSRGYFREEGWTHVQDGVRHYRVRIKKHVPNFIRFGKILIHFRYDGQPRTCRHCNQTGHYVNACHSIICYNCEELGHLASDCPHEVLCNICKQPDHRAIACPYSWARQVNHEEVPEQQDASHDDSNEETAREDPPVENSEQPDNSEPSALAQQQNMELSTPEECLSASEDPNLPDPPETLELFTEPATPPPRPQHSKSGTRRPAQLQTTVVPSRTPTQPVLVTGKPREDSAENIDIDMNSEQSDKAPKRKSPEKMRTNKHKKHK